VNEGMTREYLPLALPQTQVQNWLEVPLTWRQSPHLTLRNPVLAVKSLFELQGK